LESGLAAQKLPNHQPGNPKSGRPACSSDGVTATRFAGWVDEKETWRTLPCPNRLCEYRQMKPAACKSSSRLYFMPLWDHFKDAAFHGPSPLIRWPTHAWENAENLIGFFDYVSRQAEQLGVIPMREPADLVYNPAAPIFGLRFSLRLATKTKRDEGHKWPVVAITPEVNLIEFLLAQRERLKMLQGGTELKVLTGGALDPAEQEASELIADHRMLSPGIPGAVVVPPEPEIVEDAVVIGSADWIAEQCEAAINAAEAMLWERFPGNSTKAERDRSAARERCFGVGSRMLLAQLSLDGLADGLEKLRAS
jgi:hypothetical protein